MGDSHPKDHLNISVQAEVFIRRERESRTKKSGVGGVESSLYVSKHSPFPMIILKPVKWRSFLWLRVSKSPGARMSFPEASSYNMLKRLLAIYGRHDKPGLCFKAYFLFPDLGKIICYLIKKVILLISIRFHVSSVNLYLTKTYKLTYLGPSSVVGIEFNRFI